MRERAAALSHGRADAVRAGITTADHDDVESIGVHLGRTGIFCKHGLGRAGQIVHSEVHTGELAPIDRQIARLRRTGTQHDGVVIPAHHLCFVVVTDIGIANELDTFLLKELDATHHYILLVELHVGDAVHQKSARSIGTLEHRHRVTCTIQLLSRCKTGRTRTDDRHLLTRTSLRRLGDNPAFLKASLDDGVLNVLDRDGWRIDAEHARPFAGRRTHTPGELGEVIGLVQAIECFAPKSAIDEIVPLGDQIVDGAACRATTDHLTGVTKRHAAVHATSRLITQTTIIEMMVKLAPIFDSLDRRTVERCFAQIFNEPCRLAHDQLPPTRDKSREFSSNAAMMASSPESP